MRVEYQAFMTLKRMPIIPHEKCLEIKVEENSPQKEGGDKYEVKILFHQGMIHFHREIQSIKTHNNHIHSDSKSAALRSS